MLINIDINFKHTNIFMFVLLYLDDFIIDFMILSN